mmetsp:Transcript_129447/g.374891  ORF Transcript_129447/g.374891 Transcript_129447/m.374891 type:complete len:211 (+) Transcript_129447:819-1451(+)
MRHSWTSRCTFAAATATCPLQSGRFQLRARFVRPSRAIVTSTGPQQGACSLRCLTGCRTRRGSLSHSSCASRLHGTCCRTRTLLGHRRSSGLRCSGRIRRWTSAPFSSIAPGSARDPTPLPLRRLRHPAASTSAPPWSPGRWRLPSPPPCSSSSRAAPCHKARRRRLAPPRSARASAPSGSARAFVPARKSLFAHAAPRCASPARTFQSS